MAGRSGDDRFITTRRQSKPLKALAGAGEPLAGNPHEDPGSFLPHGKGSRSLSDTVASGAQNGAGLVFIAANMPFGL
jgi:hypothetical protein